MKGQFHYFPFVNLVNFCILLYAKTCENQIQTTNSFEIKLFLPVNPFPQLSYKVFLQHYDQKFDHDPLAYPHSYQTEFRILVGPAINDPHAIRTDCLLSGGLGLTFPLVFSNMDTFKKTDSYYYDLE